MLRILHWRRKYNPTAQFSSQIKNVCCDFRKKVLPLITWLMWLLLYRMSVRIQDTLFSCAFLSVSHERHSDCAVVLFINSLQKKWLGNSNEDHKNGFERNLVQKRIQTEDSEIFVLWVVHIQSVEGLLDDGASQEHNFWAWESVHHINYKCLETRPDTVTVRHHSAIHPDSRAGLRPTRLRLTDIHLPGSTIT